MHFRCIHTKCKENVAHPTRGGFTFESLVPVCPSCKTDGRKPRLSGIVMKVNIIHFDPPTEYYGIGQNHVACDPKQHVGRRFRATGEHHLVTCKKCRASKAYLDSYVENENDGVAMENDEDVMEALAARAGGANAK